MREQRRLAPRRNEARRSHGARSCKKNVQQKASSREERPPMIVLDDLPVGEWRIRIARFLRADVESHSVRSSPPHHPGALPRLRVRLYPSLIAYSSRLLRPLAAPPAAAAGTLFPLRRWLSHERPIGPNAPPVAACCLDAPVLACCRCCVDENAAEPLRCAFTTLCCCCACERRGQRRRRRMCTIAASFVGPEWSRHALTFQAVHPEQQNGSTLPATPQSHQAQK